MGDTHAALTRMLAPDLPGLKLEKLSPGASYQDFSVKAYTYCMA